MDMPTPSEPVRMWLANLLAQHEPVVAALHALAGSVAPAAHEMVYHGALGYGPSDSGYDRVLYVAVFASHVDLGFEYGASLNDPARLVAGSGARMRHVTIRLAEDCAHPALRPLVGQAWANGLRSAAQRRSR